MKKTGLKQPTLVLMAGLPGVGKTTLAIELGFRLKRLSTQGWVVIDKDTIKDSLLEDTLLKERIAEDTAGRAAYETFFKLAQDFLINQHMSVILDSSTLHPFILEHAMVLAARSRVQLKVILCEVDERTRQHRLRTRKTRISQARGRLVPKEAANQFDKLPPHTKRICTKGPLKEYVKAALAYVLEQESAGDGQTSAKLDGSDERTVIFARPFKIAGILRRFMHTALIMQNTQAHKSKVGHPGSTTTLSGGDSVN